GLELNYRDRRDKPGDDAANLRRIHLSVTISTALSPGTFLGTGNDRHADRRMCAAHRDRAGAALFFRLRHERPTAAVRPAELLPQPRRGRAARSGGGAVDDFRLPREQ